MSQTILCRHCGTAIYQRRRFGGTAIVWVHEQLDSSAVQQCSGAQPGSATTASQPQPDHATVAVRA